MERRPDPKELLEYVKKEERREKKQASGKLKIFLGAAPGVGKTYSMLESALARQQEGLSVVAGLVETHGRRETEVLLEKIEVLPRKKLEYRGKKLQEFDLDGALDCNPNLLLVDEMAHTNVPGSRHNKRWQDIIELLDRGIDVYTTVNVQHIESLNNIVTQITGIVVRETVPDTVFERATGIELVDLPPEDLLQRLAEGKVYVPEDIVTAKENYFRRGNLTALRELALRFTADQVDTEVLLHRRGESIEKIWPTKERLLVCIGPDPDAPKLIRITKRLAKALHAEWIAVSIETANMRYSPSERKNVIAHLRLAELEGAETLMVGGTNIAKDILTIAHERNATKIIVSKKSKKGFWKNLFSKSLADEFVRASSDVDIYILHSEAEEVKTYEKNPLQVENPKLGYLMSILTVIICTAINFIFNNYLDTSTFVMVYLLGVIYISVKGYYGPAIVATFLSALTFDYMFLPPQFMFGISDLQSIITLITMIIVSLIVVNLTILHRKQAEFSRWREFRIANLHLLSKQLAAARGVKKLLEIARRQIEEVFDCKVLALLPNDDNQLEPVLGPSLRPNEPIDRTALTEKDQSVAQWVYELGQIAGHGTETLPENEAIFIPLLGSKGTVGVLQVIPKDPNRFLIPDQLHLLESFANQTALAIEVDRLQEEAQDTKLQRETDKVSNILLTYISDSMRPPLIDIIGSTNNLIALGEQLNSEPIRILSTDISENAEELNHLVNNLSQIIRLETGPSPTKKLHSLEKVINAALKRLSRRLEKRPVLVKMPESLPKLYFNSVFLEQVFFNILENAIKYTPPLSPIDIFVYVEKPRVLVSIEDQGPGLAIDEINKIFEKFYRGQSITNVGGMGLGLAICQKIIFMHGGDIWAENRLGGGAIFRFTLPL